MVEVEQMFATKISMYAWGNNSVKAFSKCLYPEIKKNRISFKEKATPYC